MKKTLLTILIILFCLTATVSCKYNAKATIKVTNVGTLKISIALTLGYDKALTHLDPGLAEIYELSWPGRGSQTVNLVRYPYGEPEKGIKDVLTVNNGDYLEFTAEFHAESGD
ncbi:MAG: hypothetical protein KAW12_08740 [Candidatus Aminicenantes bacterium]|nr:hypothetical protein [Candidatus Aminicenantes bacterium]